jgi:hypothetical protein
MFTCVRWEVEVLVFIRWLKQERADLPPRDPPVSSLRDTPDSCQMAINSAVLLVEENKQLWAKKKRAKKRLYIADVH